MQIVSTFNKFILFSQIRGKILWELFTKEGATFSAELVEILTVFKHDSLFALNNWKGEEDKEKLVKFMRETLHELVAPSELQKYYGIFKDKPSKFMLLDEKELDEMVSPAKKLFKSQTRPENNKPGDNHSSVVPQVSSNGSQACGVNSEIVTAEKILKEKISLEEQLTKHFDNELSHLTAEDGSYGFSVLKTASGSSYESTVNCPFPKCDKMTKITKNGSRWNPGNYYRHLRSHESVNKKGNKEKGSKRKKENTLDNFLSGRNRQETGEVQDSDKDSSPSEKKKKRSHTSNPLSESDSDREVSGGAGDF